ncbi:RNA polymerase sigma factor [Salinibacillus xinjiangensis]|uniref:Sigma-70 family RNA polymerase sigma factor n=1 Tax=Salinibacillus xinjiangensis TaxID=1229268 RepID=A0A6G1XA72_9BACI|nr:RNA polymerase sigma factor [Salinibacillus xinjiangensis]MRG87805.1 sigma-70 family RNA polymerase sigma factor [Salinibacillus xinjiangensis]
MANEEIITSWFRQYSDDVYNFLIYYVGNGDVDDMVQEVFIKALRNIESFQYQSKPRTWLFSIARNVAIDKIRKHNREKRKEDKLIQYQTGTNELSPEEIYQFSETKREVFQAMQSLNKNYYEVLLLRGINELSVQETASILNWTPSKVKVTFHRAIKKLTKEMGGIK